MNKRLLYFLVVVLLGFNLFWVFNSKITSRKNEEFSIEKEQLALEVDFWRVYSKLLTISSLDKALTSQIDDLTVVFFYTEDACGACLERIYSDLDILSENIGNNSILVVTKSLQERKDLNAEFYGFRSFYSNTLNIDLEEMNQPFLFVTDGKLVSHLFIPELMEGLRNEYFTTTLPSYFD